MKNIGSHRNVTVHGTIFFNDEKRVILTEGGTTTDTFIASLKKLLRGYDIMALIVDRARTHTSKKLKNF